MTCRPFLMRLILALSLGVASPALAACPTPADLGQGVVLVQNEPVFRRSDVELNAAGFQEVAIIGDGANNKRVELRTYAHALTPVMEQDASGTWLHHYDPAPDGLERLDEIREARFEVTSTGDLGKQVVSQLLITFDEAGTSVVQGCFYDTWRVTVMRAEPGGEVTERKVTYAPDMGLILAQDAREASFAYTWIGTGADVAR